jgi:hypothetical protein
MTFDDIPAGSSVFGDANTFVSTSSRSNARVGHEHGWTGNDNQPPFLIDRVAHHERRHDTSPHLTRFERQIGEGFPKLRVEMQEAIELPQCRGERRSLAALPRPGAKLA